MKSTRHICGAIIVFLWSQSLCCAATVRINELVAERSDRVLRWTDDGKSRLGAGASWFEAGFDDSSWREGPGGLGFGDGDDATDVELPVRGVTPSLYTRRTFDVSSGNASHSGQISLTVDFDDGFVAYLNGQEVMRKNLGPSGAFVYHDQTAYNEHEQGTPVTASIGTASALLVPGENILAIQTHNIDADDDDMTIKADLEITDSVPIPLVDQGDTWRYMAGTHEPSGAFMDPAFLPGDPALNVAWGQPGFDDSTWSTGPGGIGFGDDDDATILYVQMYGITPSVYMRHTFEVSAATAERPDSIILTIDYDDGFVAYLNGQEVARRTLGFPHQFTPHTTLATSAREAGTPEAISIGIASNLLSAGTNVLAIQAHNCQTTSSDVSLIADLAIPSGSPEQFVVHSNDWAYFVGICEPCPPPKQDKSVTDASFFDWVELVNTGAAPVSMEGWSLTDDRGNSDKWLLPDITLGTDEYLVIFCSGKDVTNATATYLHTSFSLARGGEYLGLYDNLGLLVDEFAQGYPLQSAFHSYGRDDSSGINRFFATPTPGAANSGDTYEGVVPEPAPSSAADFYASQISVAVTCPLPGSTIRYTTNGKVPSEATGTLYSGPISVADSTALRFRAFKDDCIPSATVTKSYLIGEVPAVRSIPAVSIVANFQQSIHKANGVTAIAGGVWNNNIWQAEGPDDYNIPRMRGRPYERPLSLEVLYNDTNAPVQIDAGLRTAGSEFTRARYILQDLSGAWNQYTHINKAQFNVYFRNDYGPEKLKANLFPLSPVESLTSLRLRSGKNDWYNPFITDEFVRRLYADMGQVSSLGILVNLFVNGEYRSYYNACARYDEHFLTAAHGTKSGWDIINHGGVAEGDSFEWDSLLAFVRYNDISIPANYQEVCRRLDMDNYIDYLCLNTYGGTLDWPNNNWYAARERSLYGQFRFYVWDAEGAFGRRADQPEDFDSFTSDLLSKHCPISWFYMALRQNEDFQMRFADRVYEHFYNSGTLVDTNMVAQYQTLSDRLAPILMHNRGQLVSDAATLNWISERRSAYFAQLQVQGLISTTAPPSFVHPGGVVSNGFVVQMNVPGSPSTVYYTIDDTDPRATGGAPSGSIYTAPFALDRSRTIKARAFSGDEWSPLVTASYISIMPPLVVSELMYNSADGTGCEFIELVNVGTSTVSLAAMQLSGGITFQFELGSVDEVPPGGYVLVVDDEADFASRYDSNGMMIAGTYGGKLANDGELIELSHNDFGLLTAFSYRDGWHDNTDGDGFSLTVIDPAGDTAALNSSLAWRPSHDFGGSPGGIDRGHLPNPGAMVINEALTHTDASPVGDWIELHNTTFLPIDIGGWYLSDSETNLMKYAVPLRTWVMPGSFISFDATNHFFANPLANGFALSELGDEIYLCSGTNSTGEMTGFRTSVKFGAAEREVTFGRHTLSNGETDFVALLNGTRDNTNSELRIGPIVISEIMYGPTSNCHEYIELYNLTGANVPLYDPSNPTNTWRIEGGVDFEFPQSVEIEPFSSCLVVGTNPVAFRSLYSLPLDIQIFGSYSGRLDNAGESIRLCRPGDPDLEMLPYILVDRVKYEDSSPWPCVPNGCNQSIERIHRAAYGNEPINWRLSATGGTMNASVRVDSDGDGIPDEWEQGHGLVAADAADGATDSDSDGLTAAQEYVAGSSPSNSSDALCVVLTASNGQTHVSFPTRDISGIGYTGLERLYLLERTIGLTEPDWAPVPGLGVITGFDGTAICTDTNCDVTPAFYRARIWLTEP